MNINKPDSSAEASGAPAQSSDENRRSFLVSFSAVCVGAVATLVPAAVSAVSFLNPLTRRGDDSLNLRVTTLDALADGGAPMRFPVVMSRTDAWCRLPEEPVGAVYLRRVGDEVTAHNAICPHLGCFVEFRNGSERFECPCHDSKFETDGSRIDPEKCPSPRDLDALEVVVEENGEVWVRFENFRANSPEKIAEV